MYDIIGDIHGQATKLINLLTKLGYQSTAQGYVHPTNKAIFVGDFIDRGPYQLETVKLVKRMIDNNNAYGIMGNHEFNAVGWAMLSTCDANEYLRPHSARNLKQHKIFLQQVDEFSQEHHYWIEWFKSLPLFLELPELRVIHACWDNQVIAQIRPYLDNKNCLLAEYWQAAFTRSHPLFNLCEILLKGKEVTLPEGIYYKDKEGTERHRARIKWWLDDARSYRQLCLIPTQEQIITLDQPVDNYESTYAECKSVFFGHYWLDGEPQIITEYCACLDYSAALVDGKLVAYRWQGEAILTNAHFCY